jgi:hypothetical protein
LWRKLASNDKRSPEEALSKTIVQSEPRGKALALLAYDLKIRMLESKTMVVVIGSKNINSI